MQTAIKIKNLSVIYGNTEALTDVCVDIKKGEFLGIIGPNGGGKSTLLKSILGLTKGAKGEIEIMGKPNLKNTALVGYVPQFALMDRKFPISVIDVIKTGFLKNGIHPFHHYRKDDRKKALEYLKRVGIEELCDRQISELSGGEFQRMLVARALATNPQILLLDEPTASVDPLSREQIYKLLSELNHEGITIVLVTHDMLAIASEVSSLACINQHLIYHGEPKLTEDVVHNMYGCPVDLIAHGVPHRVLKDHCCGGEH